jgi:hypothetical protein
MPAGYENLPGSPALAFAGPITPRVMDSGDGVLTAIDHFRQQ